MSLSFILPHPPEDTKKKKYERNMGVDRASDPELCTARKGPKRYPYGTVACVYT